MTGDPLDRDQYTGAASPRQYRAGRRWASRRNRWAPHTEQDRLDDFDGSEQQNEIERYRGR